jgi:hypothetical protein
MTPVEPYRSGCPATGFGRCGLAFGHDRRHVLPAAGPPCKRHGARLAGPADIPFGSRCCVDTRGRISLCGGHRDGRREPVPVEGYPSGQRGRTVNPLAFAFVGSNPTPSTTSPASRTARMTTRVLDRGRRCTRFDGVGGCSSVVRAPAFQAGRVGSIPITRSSSRRSARFSSRAGFNSRVDACALPPALPVIDSAAPVAAGLHAQQDERHGEVEV